MNHPANEGNDSIAIHVGANQCAISWHDVIYEVADRKTGTTKRIIDNASGYAKPGEFLAIMGGSGAGKSTMLDLVRGRIQPSSGKFLFNGNRRPKNFKHIAKYVQQDDALYPILTVRETIMYAARLQLPSGLSTEELNSRVDKLIALMGLTRCANTRIGNAVTAFMYRGISGGERRRVSICVELVTDPEVIILDEPTSGLDSEAARNVIQVLQKLAHEQNKTIVATIHQPSSDIYVMFDKLLLLSRGHIVFHGPAGGASVNGGDPSAIQNAPDNALSYFAKVIDKPCPQFYNPPDHFMAIMNVDFEADQTKANSMVQVWAKSFSESNIGKRLKSDIDQIAAKPKPVDDIPVGFAISTIMQTYILTERSFKNAYRNVLVYWIRVAMFGCMAILMGTTFFDIGLDATQIQDRFSAHFFAVAFLCFMAVASIPGIIEEKNVFDREVMNGAYNVLSYVISNTLTSLPFVMIITLVFTAIAYPLIMFQSGVNSVLNYILFLFLALYTMESIIVCISSLMPIFVVALAVGAFLNGFFMCVQGFFVRVSSLPLFWRSWAHYWSYQKWAFEGLVKSDFSGLVFNCIGSGPTCFCAFQSSLNAQCKMSGDDIIASYGYDVVDLRNWALVLLLNIVLYRIAMFLILKYKTRETIH